MKGFQRRQHIVIVDDNPVNLDLAENFLKGEYKVTKLISGEQLIKLLSRVKPDMILLDIQMPGLNGYDTLKAVRENQDTCDIPVIFITAQKDASSEQEGFRLGAQDYIGKPFDTSVTLSRIRSQLELYQYRNNLEEMIKEKTQRIEDLQRIITISWAEMVESRDGTTGSHVRNTAKYFEAILHFLYEKPGFSGEFPNDSLSELVQASIIHDIGKIGISDHVLKKPGPLSKEEFDLMKNHSQIGANMIQKIMDNSYEYDFLMYAKNMALYHHERWNGTGYPCGLSGDKIPAYVRALSIADVYDALTSVRPYKIAYSHQETMDIMYRDRGKFFCPEYFDIFVDNHEAIHKILKEKSE